MEMPLSRGTNFKNMKHMKKIQWIIGGLLLWIAGACTEDKGNYDYTPLNELTIGGLEKSYTVEQSERLSIVADIKGKDGFDADRYDYLWYTWRINNAADPDTLSREKDLDINVEIAVGEYNLRYVVTEKETGVYYKTDVDMYVINSYSQGVVALSSVDGKANLTFINSVNRVTENAYQTANGEVAGTRPVGIFYTGGSEWVIGTLIVATAEGSKVVDPSDFSEMMPFTDFFYITPENQVTQGLCKNEGGFDEYVIVGGRIYNRRVAFVDNLFQKYDPAIKGDYEAAPFSMYEAGDFFFYDQKGKRFLYASSYDGATPVEKPASGDFDPTDMKATMTYGIAFKENARAVMDGDNGERFVIAVTKMEDCVGEWPDVNYYYRVIPERKIVIDRPGFADATSFAVSSYDIDFLYYAEGNKIVCVGMQGGAVIAEFDGFAAGEQVDYMEFDRTDKNPTRLYVGVSDGSGAANSGSIYYLRMNSDGSLKKEAYFEKVCGKVVDFEYKP